MGCFTRFNENAKQTIGLKDGADWKPTSNARNTLMISETKKFALQIKALHRDFSDKAKSFDVSVGVTKTALTTALPRVYEASANGPPVLAGGEAKAASVGTVNFDVMAQSGTDLKTALQNEALRPLEQWLSAYREIKRKNAKGEEWRLELDAQRRSAIAAAAALEKERAKAAKVSGAVAAKEGTEGATPPAAAEQARSKIEHGQFKLHAEEDAVTRLTQRFSERESEVFHALVALIRDTQEVMTRAAAAAYAVFASAYQQAHKAFPEVKLPAPALAPTVSEGGTPIPTPAPAPGKDDQTPVWYNEAMQNVPSMKYESDDEHKFEFKMGKAKAAK